MKNQYLKKQAAHIPGKAIMNALIWKYQPKKNLKSEFGGNDTEDIWSSTTGFGITPCWPPEHWTNIWQQ